MKRTLAYMIPFLGAVAWSCAGGGGAGGGWGGEVRDSSGISIVENTNEGTWGAEGGWRVEEILRIGSSLADPEFASTPEYQFGQISGIAVSQAGAIFVVDQQAQQIRAFDPEGTFVRSIGLAGSGPGELGIGAGPALMARGDTLVVPDASNQRVNLYATDGGYITSWPLSFQDGIPIRWEASAAGLVVSQVRPVAFPGQPAVTDTMDAIVARGADGTILDTLMRMPSGKTFSFGGGGQAPEFNFFSPEPAWALYPGGSVLFGINDQYRIGFHDGGGTLQRILRMPTSRRPVGARDQEAFITAIERAWADAGVPPQGIAQLRSGINFAEQYPAFLQFFAGPNGSVWVQHVADLSAMSDEDLENFNPLLTLGGARWDVFDAEGRFMGPIDMPARFQPVRFEDDRIYGIWRDEYDVQHVMVMQVVTT